MACFQVCLGVGSRVKVEAFFKQTWVYFGVFFFGFLLWVNMTHTHTER